MKLHNLLILIVFLASSAMYSQKKKITKSPVSIYTLANLSSTQNSYWGLNNKLKLNNYKFVFLDHDNLDLNLFSIQSGSIGTTPTALIYDDYTSYRDEYLLKGWLRKYDPTRWPFHCPNPLSVQPEN